MLEMVDEVCGRRAADVRLGKLPVIPEKLRIVMAITETLRWFLAMHNIPIGR